MTYTKPELLAAEVALNAILGGPKEDWTVEDAIPEMPATLAAYEVDE